MFKTTPFAFRACCIALVVAFGPLGARAMFMPANNVPVERLIQNVTAYVKENPNDANGYYTLARVYNLAFSLDRSSLRVWDHGKQLLTIPDMFNRAAQASDARLDPKLHREYLLASIQNYNKAISMQPKNGLYHLGLASVLEAALGGARELPPIPEFTPGKEIKDWKPVYLNQAIREYLQAYDLTVAEESKIQHRPLQGLDALVSYEAGRHYVALAQREGVEAAMKARIKPIEAQVQKYQNLPMGAITPVVFAMTPVQRLDELLDPSIQVKFDLDGTGREQSWPWVKPGTGILAWDPQNSGTITSGRQLFGTVSWWIFWQDGYAALDALDDNRDGQLRGEELRGLVVWFDRNSNGVSDAGEVMPLQSAGIEQIRTKWTGRDGRSYTNRLGMKLKDGRVLPTWDWVVERAK